MIGYYISTRDGLELASDTLEGAIKMNEVFPGSIFYFDGKELVRHPSRQQEEAR